MYNKEGEIEMSKLEGFTKVAAIKYAYGSPYYFAIYDDGTNYVVGDLVMVSGGSHPGRIVEIINFEELRNRTDRNITAEVICRIDTSAYDSRVEHRRQKEKLRKELEKRKKEIQKKLDDDYYAYKDATYAEMLKEYERL